MPNSVLKTNIREFAIKVDSQFEEEIGIYGNDFWNGIANGTYEVDTFDFIERRAREGSKLLIDVGSATGCMALFASALEMSVVATEPQNLVYEALHRNIQLNPQLAKRIKMLHCLIGATLPSTRSNSEFFTPGASGPLEKEIVADVVTLESILMPVSIEDRVSLKVDIEGAEYPLLSDYPTLAALSAKKATMYLSFHPGFSRNLSSKPNQIEMLSWRTRTLLETIVFVWKLKKFAKISLLKSDKSLSIFEVVRQLHKDQKDFILNF
jgi:FkbM family methyltransferase